MNLRGWSTKRKLLVIESDDWGSVRMQSPEAFNYYKNKGYAVEKCVYNRFDRLESNDDIEILLETLTSLKDNHGHSAKFTLNNVVANPDFDRIGAANFEKYFYEPFTETYKRYPNHDRVMDLYKVGVENGCFSIQFHGREHVNIDNWLQHLRNGDKVAIDAFSQQMFSVHKLEGNTQARVEFLDTYGLGYEGRRVNHSEAVVDGLKLFEKIWNRKSLTMIAPTYVWSNEIELAAKLQGVRAMQSFYVQIIPSQSSREGVKLNRVYQGRVSSVGLINLMRNVFFEPSSDPTLDWVRKCMREIDIAFLMRKPAIIATHRVNYMGGMSEENRISSIKTLKNLLKALLKKYPDVEFLGSEDFANMIIK